jgi:hypothetical protein
MAGTLSKSQKKKHKKKAAAANKADETDSKVNGGDHSKSDAEDHDEDAEDEAGQTVRDDPDADDVDDEQPPLSPTIQTNGTPHHSISSAIALGLARSRSQQGISASPPPPSDTSARLDAITKERDALRQQVTELKSAATSDGSNSNYEEEIRSLREELDEANEGKEHFETQYKNLLGRVNTIKTSLGDRLKADAVRVARDMPVRVLTMCRPESRNSNRKSPTSKNRRASYKRITIALQRSSQSCDKKRRLKHPRSRHCEAGRTSHNKTGSRNATNSFRVKHTQEKSLKMPNKPCKTGKFWP